MTTFPGSPRLVKGGIVPIDAGMSAQHFGLMRDKAL